ncbi:Os07g0218600 [Oryza sativa Japonica Group]|uniref:Os07g0218600 protein n=1 Tax=Oryza sativa subsp. japonica TaxID=39947 RepID=A0A0P0X4A7_ORYSJ|nr:hypothetical protein EE612_037905 [Oryza sativa]BAT00636.1 Os07g0218600 [Oryza sativa Japonica Group]
MLSYLQLIYDLTCVLCANGHGETRENLFFFSPFSQRLCWRHLGIL